ncbi:hypothetical protein P3T76_014375 [Phytophthora citrophthora]|uniref:Uncharacterized protein n=1 Tax=Phytophthora citrophthora TaxID=4793 RepID=A0AAD9LBB3_9STRA|nr:hypothetical protein P3T76_014375 [Phytophthora citrophthora]
MYPCEGSWPTGIHPSAAEPHAASEKAFQARWRELKKAGWTSKRPTGLGLSVNFTYLKPGKTIKDVKGEDVLVGEEALMKYLDKIDLGKTACCI